MFDEEDILEAGNCLKMESYKALNRELTIKNQELRQHGTALREELCDVRRRLVEERSSQAYLKKAIISVITESFNTILCLLYENDTDKKELRNGLASGDTTQNENSEDAGTNRRSYHLSRSSRGDKSTPPRKSFVDSNITKRSPLAEVQNNNVTMRNKRGKQLECSSRELIQETEDSEEEEDFLDRVEHPLEVNMSPEEKENSMELPVVIEETSSKMDMSSLIHQRGNRVFELKLSTSTGNTENTLMPDLNENEEKSNLKNVMESGDPRSEEINPLSSLTVPDIPFNESSFNNSSMLKAPSSTPYKKVKNNQSGETSQRSLRVLIPRLKKSSLPDFGITESLIEDTRSQQSYISSPKPSTSKSRKKNSAKNISPKIENKSQNNKSSPRRRPKRKAAEAAKSHLVEPTLTIKLRRKN